MKNFLRVTVLTIMLVLTSGIAKAVDDPAVMNVNTSAIYTIQFNKNKAFVYCNNGDMYYDASYIEDNASNANYQFKFSEAGTDAQGRKLYYIASVGARGHYAYNENTTNDGGSAGSVGLTNDATTKANKGVWYIFNDGNFQYIVPAWKESDGSFTRGGCCWNMSSSSNNNLGMWGRGTENPNYAGDNQLLIKKVERENYVHNTGTIVDNRTEGQKRKLNSFTITDGINSLEVTNIQETFTSPVYSDKTDSKLTTYAGATLKFSEFTYTSTWMHAYAYVDYNKNYCFELTNNNDGRTDGEIVSYNYLNGKTITGVDGSEGNAMANEYNGSKTLPAFTLPDNLEPGEYRMRVKVDWNNIDADYGADRIAVDGGCQCDITLVIRQRNSYTINATAGNGGSITINGESVTSKVVAEGSTVTLVATPDTYKKFINWTKDGVEVSTNATYTFPATENTSLVANFDYIFPDGAYKIHWEYDGRGYLAYHATAFPNEAKLADVTLGDFGGNHYNSSTDQVDLVWYLITANDGANEGKRYLFQAATGKFLCVDESKNNPSGSSKSKANKLSTTEATPITIDANPSRNGHYVIKATANNTIAILSSGCGTSSKTGSPVRWWYDNTAASFYTDGGSPLKLEAVENVTVNASIIAFARNVINGNVQTISSYDEFLNNFENGQIYYFETSRGVLAATENSENLVSTANTTISNLGMNNPYCQWTVYKNDGKYYLYNIGKGMFMGTTTINEGAIPFTQNPVNDGLVFKATNKTDYPIMFTCNTDIGVVNHNTSKGLIYWSEGWTNLNDDGNCHKVTLIGELDRPTLQSIEAAVTAMKPVDVTLTDAQGNKYIERLDGFINGITKETVAAKLLEKYPYITLGTEVANIELKDGNDAYTYTNTVELPFKVTNGTYIWHNIYWPSNDYPEYLAASSADDTYVPKVTGSYAYGDHTTYNTQDGNNNISWAIYNVNNGFEFIFMNKVTLKYIKATSVAEGNAQNVEYVENADDATAFIIEKKPAGNDYYTTAQYSLAANVGEAKGYLCSTEAGYDYATHYNSNGHQGAWIEFVESPDYYTIIHELNDGLEDFGEGEGKYIANDAIAPIIEAMKNSGKVTWNKLNEYKTEVDNIALDEWVKIELTVSNENYGTVSIAGEEVKSKFAPKNKAIELLATPKTGYHFVNWTNANSEEVSTENPLTLNNVTEAVSLVANFEKKIVNVTLRDDTNENIEADKRHVYEFVLDNLEGEATTDAIAAKLMEKYPVIESLGSGTNTTLIDNGTSYTYTNSVKLQFLIANGRDDDGITWYNIYYPVNINNQPNYLSASSSKSTYVEKINDDTYAYGDNPTYNKEIGNAPISWAIYSVDHTLTFALKNKVADKFIQVTSVETGNAQNAVFTNEANATAFAISKKTINPVDYYAFAAEIDGTTGYLSSTDNNYDYATLFNSNDNPGAWAIVEDPAYYTQYLELLWGLWEWFAPVDGLCTVTDKIQAIKEALNNYEIITLNTLKSYGLILEAANLTWPTITLDIKPNKDCGTTNINGEKGMTSRRAPADYEFPVEAMPTEGYHFTKWTDATGNTLSTDAKYFTTISGVKGDVTTITANFEINIYTINVTAGEGGSAMIGTETSATVEHGSEVTLTATANNGYEFVNWTKEGVEVSTDAAYTFTATADGEYTANFVEIKEVAAVRYYRIGYDFDNGGKRYYMQSIACGVNGNNNLQNALLMKQETGATSIFYYADSKLLSYDKGTYVKENDGTRGLQAVGESGTVTITTSQSTGKSTIAAPSYLHANTNGTVYYADHCGSDNGHANHNFVLEEVTTLPVTISSALHATFYAPVAVAIPEGVKAYVLKAEDIPGIETYAWMTSLKNGIIPANTGVIIKGAEGKYYFDIVENNDAARAEAVGNVLSGTVAKTKITEDAYILANREGKVGLYPVAKNSYLDTNTNATTVRFTNNSHKAYLPVKNDWFGEQLKMGTGFRFVYDDEETTGIEEFETENTETIYDLQGRKLSEITEPGIYIVGGKKVWVK